MDIPGHGALDRLTTGSKIKTLTDFSITFQDGKNKGIS